MLAAFNLVVEPVMRFKSVVHRAPIALALVGVVACSTQSAPEKPALARPDHDRIAAVQAIRAASAGEDSALQVNPLRDPAVEGHLAQALAYEKEQRYEEAFLAIERARKLSPDAPDLLQTEAEIELLRGNTQRAEKLAYESFQKGPQVGTLCVQNWQTMIEARKIFNDPKFREVAERNREKCKVPRPTRL
jgi:tetratricopeptide (TPR) repeat protein